MMGADVLAFALCLLIVAVTVGDVQSLGSSSPNRPICRKDEEYQRCGCLKTCCNGGKPQNCAAQCTAGCFCKDGLVRNKNGDCIPLKDCQSPETCPVNQQYSNCGSACPPTCEDPGPYRPCTQQCIKGCFCKQGFVLNRDGDCVKPEECYGPPTPSCGVDEEFYGCVPTCRDTCANYNQTNMACPLYCRSGCFCKKGWVKRSDGKCVPTSQCNLPTKPPTPSCGVDEEYYGCIPTCRDTCENYNNTHMACPLICRSGCFCKKGWVKRSDGKCVPTSQCNHPTKPPTPSCGVDEEYYGCVPTCRNTCENYNNTHMACPLYCLSGCFCKKGWVKRSDGKCVPTSQCTPTTGSCKENEQYSDCVNPCNDCEIRGMCQFLKCTKGCDCKKGYHRDTKGNCIPAASCPTQKECGVDEEYKECGTACPRTCANLPYQIRCIAKCVEGCFCKEGLVRNDDNVCVTPDACENDQCGVNEVYKTCGTSCPDTCSNLGKPQVCTDLCVSGCFCRNGFVRSDNGLCIDPSECPTEVCGENEEYTTCGSACPKTCENKDKNIICTLQCVPGCFCVKGYVRNSRGRCIDPRQCETKQCGVNEEFLNCGSACPATCSNHDKRRICTQQCVRGCFCKKGYIKDAHGKCVTPSECPRQCGVDEVYQECGTACPRTCASLYTKIKCIEKCVPGCFCRDDLVRDNGKCIDIRDCQTQTCGMNEEYKKCGTACPETCSNLGKPQVCIALCVAGCFCKEGFVKNDNGECVKRTECPSNQCGVDEVYKECGTACPRTCESIFIKINCIDKCVPGCFCRDDLVRENGKCIDIKKCPIQQCGVDEEYNNCGTACPVTCSNRGSPVICTEQCVKGCFCKQGLVRDDRGKCVNPNQCPRDQCGEYEEYQDCGTACPRTCRNLRYQIKCIAKCVPGCFCQEGFVRNDEGECVDPSECPDEDCGENEIYSTCGSACPLTCDNKDKQMVCTLQCKIGCFCKKGYVRDKDGKCILADQCPTECKGKNEAMVDCAKPKWCNTCEIRGNCKLKECDKGCDCKPDFYRNASGVCIPKNQCPVFSDGSDCDKDAETGPCKAHMPRFYYDKKSGRCKSFIYGGCRGNKNNFNTEAECYAQCGGDGSDCNKAPEAGMCYAYIPRFYYDPKSRTCKSFVYGGCGGNKNNFQTETECYSGCGVVSDGYDCDKDAETGPCRALLPRFYYNKKSGKCENFIYGGCLGNKNNFKTEAECTSGCGVVSDGYDCDKDAETGPCRARIPRFYYNKKSGKCESFIYGGCRGNKNNFKTEAECTSGCGGKVCGVDEQYYHCAPDCKNTCDNYNKPHVVCPKICRLGCFCKEGLVKRSDGKCVNPSECNVTTDKCGVDEEYKTCGTACPPTCSNARKEISCSKQCVKGCFCKRGLVRNEDGKCVKIEKCPNTCGEDEVYKICGTACPRTCRNLHVKISCTRTCVKGCFCKDGLVRNDDGECVEPAECPDEVCGKHEKYSTCGSACPLTCENKDKQMACTLQCKIGCFCEEGYVRNKDGKCVLPEQCTTEKCSGYNEVQVDCAKPKWCNTCGIRGDCKLSKCDKGCDCKPRFYRNETGICIHEAQCPGFCPLNEEYSTCVVPCNDCDTRGKCNFLVCNEGCDCKKGYYRDLNNLCIPEDTCPIKEECGENEVYSTCGSACVVTCDNKDEQIFCTQECRIGCFCKKGYVRDKDGKCIPPEECPAEECHGYNEEWVDCAKPKFCNTCAIRGNCKLKKCDEGCDCKPNFYRNQTGICIPQSQCPGFCPLNEEYSKCVNPCNNCEIRGKCNFLVCNEGCDCKKGYYRDGNNICIPKETCPPKPPVCEVDEEYYNCAPDCKNTCENFNKSNVICPKICRLGCFCKKGLVKRSDGKCVKPSKCNVTEPEHQCGKNEMYYDDCAPSCTGTCETYNKTGIFNCPLCRPGCWCKKGYVKRKDGKCVKPSKCDKPTEPEHECGKKEVYYEECAPSCGGTCETYNKTGIYHCPLCRPGCWCKKGYVKRKDGKCVKPSKCDTPTEPPPVCEDDEVYYKDCAPSCTGSCDTYGKEAVILCAPCRPGCWCKKGFVKGKDGKCIKPSECETSIEPPESCGKNEIYYPDCAPKCHGTCESYNRYNILCEECSPGCWCKEGYVKRKDGKCVRPEKCNKPTPPTSKNFAPILD